jgi:hypothetical protein
VIVREDSPLRRLPEALEPRQASFLDGIRFSIEIADLAYSRLVGTLHGLSLHSEKSTADPLGPLIAGAISDAWLVVNSINRLRYLLEHLPMGKKSRWYSLRAFLQNTKPITELRHIVQHLNEKIAGLAEKGKPVWGSLSWFHLLDSKKGRSCMIVAGRLAAGEHRFVNPLGKPVRAPIDHVTLTSGDITADLSATMVGVVSLTGELETSLRKSFKDLPTSGADALFFVEVEFGDG